MAISNACLIIASVVIPSSALQTSKETQQLAHVAGDKAETDPCGKCYQWTNNGGNGNQYGCYVAGSACVSPPNGQFVCSWEAYSYSPCRVLDDDTWTAYPRSCTDASPQYQFPNGWGGYNTVEKCKQACLDDPKCTGIDYYARGPYANQNCVGWKGSPKPRDCDDSDGYMKKQQPTVSPTPAPTPYPTTPSPTPAPSPSPTPMPTPAPTKEDCVTTLSCQEAFADAPCPCPEGKAILDEQACEAMAASLGVKYNVMKPGNTWPKHVKGCTMRPNGIYFNKHPTGTDNCKWAKPVCA